MHGGVWGGNFSISVGGGTLGAAVGSSVGVSGSGATLRAWWGSALVTVLGSSLRPCRGAGSGDDAGTTIGIVAACVAKILERRWRAPSFSTGVGGTGPSSVGWRK